MHRLKRDVLLVSAAFGSCAAISLACQRFLLEMSNSVLNVFPMHTKFVLASTTTTRRMCSANTKAFPVVRVRRLMELTQTRKKKIPSTARGAGTE